MSERDEIERRYLLLRAVDGVIRHGKPRKFRLGCEAYEWTFNQRAFGAPSDRQEAASLIYLAVNGQLDIGAEIARMGALMDIEDAARREAASALPILFVTE
jgi:hypothetical protein